MNVSLTTKYEIHHGSTGTKWTVEDSPDVPGLTDIRMTIRGINQAVTDIPPEALPKLIEALQRRLKDVGGNDE